MNGFLHFLPLSSQEVFFVPSKRYKNFFFKYGEWDIKNTEFKNVNLIVVKSAPKQNFSQKIGFGATFFGHTLYQGQLYIFELTIKRRIF
jgi:hypothetical protein